MSACNKRKRASGKTRSRRSRGIEPVQRLVYYPFLTLFLLFFAQSSLFDHWVIPLSLYLLVGFTLAVLLGSAWRLRRVAESVRTEALRRLARYRMQLPGEGEGGLVSQVDEMVNQMKHQDTSAPSRP